MPLGYPSIVSQSTAVKHGKLPSCPPGKETFPGKCPYDPFGSGRGELSGFDETSKMAMPKKKSRCICIDDIDYRWRVNGEDGLIFFLTVEHKQNPGSQLRVQVWAEHSSYSDSNGRLRESRFQKNAITPAVVRAAIEQALEQGWKPAESEPPTFSLDRAATERISALALGLKS